MKTARIILLALLLAGAARGQSLIEQLDNALTFAAFDGSCRVHLSGLIDLEGYHLDMPAPDLIYTDHHNLFNPRLTLNLDAQLGSHVYGFVEARVDRGFDPSDAEGRMQLDEWALRVTPWEDGRFNVQAGKFATVVGNWASRDNSWQNPFIDAPLPYENLTGVWYADTPDGADELTSWGHVNHIDSAESVYSDKQKRVPIIWGPSYATGISVFGGLGKFDYALEVKNSALSSPPQAWQITEVGFDRPTYSGRLGWRPNEMWTFGVSASTGSFLLPAGESALAEGYGFNDYRESHPATLRRGALEPAILQLAPR
jgi:hypothetical protein